MKSKMGDNALLKQKCSYIFKNSNLRYRKSPIKSPAKQNKLVRIFTVAVFRKYISKNQSKACCRDVPKHFTLRGFSKILPNNC